jgi:chromosome segregation ATPase
MNSDQEGNGSSRAGSALVWALKILIKVAVATVLILAMIGFVWLGWQQLDRWMSRTTRRIVLLETDADFLLDNLATSETRYNNLRTQVANEEQHSATLTREIGQQSNLMATFESQVLSLADDGRSMSESVRLLGEGVISLQGDVNENVSDIDDLGGQLDSLSVDAAELESQIANLEGIISETDQQLIRLKQALYWFRLWELMARARLQISDNNLGLAAADIETALSLASSIPEAATEVETEILVAITTRLELAAQELPNEPVTAARDLESAWDIIDQVIAVLVGYESSDLSDIGSESNLSEPDEQTPTPTQASTPEAASTSEASTPEATSTP